MRIDLAAINTTQALETNVQQHPATGVIVGSRSTLLRRTHVEIWSQPVLKYQCGLRQRKRKERIGTENYYVYAGLETLLLIFNYNNELVGSYIYPVSMEYWFCSLTPHLISLLA